MVGWIQQALWAATLALCVGASGCALPDSAHSPSSDPGRPASGPTASGDRTHSQSLPSGPAPTAVAPLPAQPPTPSLAATAERRYGCPSTPCPSNLDYAVNGCT